MGSWLGEHVKIWDSLFISATVEASNFKFGIQVGQGLGNSLLSIQVGLGE